jgi:hypothetical protein
MQQLKQGTAAVALVVSLGLAVPGTLGGSASADISDHNRNLVANTFECDLDGNPNDYETTFQLVSTPNSTMWQDTQSRTVIVQRERIDVLQSEYIAKDAEGTSFVDTEAEWFDVDFAPHVYPHGKPKGWNTVRCISVSPPYDYIASERDADLEPRLVPGAAYDVIDTQLFEVTLSSTSRGAVQAASADDSRSGQDNAQTASADNGKHKAKKQGKHRGKGKRGR